MLTIMQGLDLNAVKDSALLFEFLSIFQYELRSCGCPDSSIVTCISPVKTSIGQDLKIFVKLFVRVLNIEKFSENDCF
jgi:hypothetical protein